MSNPRDGQTVTSGSGYFTRCTECKRLVLANSITWSPDFYGDSWGRKDLPARCSECATKPPTIGPSHAETPLHQEGETGRRSGG